MMCMCLLTCKAIIRINQTTLTSDEHEHALKIIRLLQHRENCHFYELILLCLTRFARFLILGLVVLTSHWMKLEIAIK